jgi:hypothetical protein
VKFMANLNQTGLTYLTLKHEQSKAKHQGIKAWLLYDTRA